MNADRELFEHPGPDYLHRIAVGALALLALAAILAATLQISAPAYGATIAALEPGPVAAPRTAPAAKRAGFAATAIPRVVIIARRERAQAAMAPVAGSF